MHGENGRRPRLNVCIVWLYYALLAELIPVALVLFFQYVAGESLVEAFALVVTTAVIPAISFGLLMVTRGECKLQRYNLPGPIDAIGFALVLFNVSMITAGAFLPTFDDADLHITPLILAQSVTAFATLSFCLIIKSYLERHSEEHKNDTQGDQNGE